MSKTSNGIPTSSDHPNLIQFGYPPGNSHIPPNGNFGNSPTQNAIFWGDMDVSENSGNPKSSILLGFSIINHPF